MSSKPLFANRSKGLLFIVSAPAGAGKSTLVDMLTSEFSSVRRSISCTTRAPRTGERNGVDYHFLTEEEFLKRIEQGQFIEHVTLFGYRYGTLKEHVETLQNEKNHVVLVIDTQGALELMGKLAATFIFILPPSLKELERRLFERGTETPETLEKRLSEADREIACASRYNYIIVNDDKNVAYQVLRSIVIAEIHRV